MGLLKRIFGMETRDRALTHKDMFLSGHIIDGMGITPAASESLGAVMACVNATSTAIASLPAYVYTATENGRSIAETHALMRLIRKGPNPYQSFPDLLEWTMAQVLLTGNAVVEIQTDGAGRLAGLMPIPWENVSVQMLPSGALAYDIVEVTTLYGSTGRRRRLLQSEVFHLRDRSDDGIIGRSRLHRAAETMTTALHVQRFTNSVYRNGVFPSGVIKAAGKLPADAIERLGEMFRSAFGGSSRAAKALILDQGLDWTQLSGLNAEDAELVAARRFTVEEICRIFGTPPPIVQDYSHNTFTNSEAAGRWFAQFTIGPWCRKIEAEFARSVLASGFELELDLSGFMRGDPETRWKSHEIAVKNRILTPNEVREVEGWNPQPDGDSFHDLGQKNVQ